jgi:excisionase family DNA binding protein
MAATTTPLDEQIRRMTPVAAPPAARGQLIDLMAALQGSRARAGAASRPRLVGPNHEEIALPETVYHLLKQLVEILARGDAITLVPVGKKLTTQQAADLLNVSRQYLVRLLENGEIPFERVGKHRRVKIEDALAYKQQRDATRRGKLAELTRLSEDAGGYDER